MRQKDSQGRRESKCEGPMVERTRKEVIVAAVGWGVAGEKDEATS